MRKKTMTMSNYSHSCTHSNYRPYIHFEHGHPVAIYCPECGEKIRTVEHCYKSADKYIAFTLCFGIIYLIYKYHLDYYITRHCMYEVMYAFAFGVF